MTYKKYPWPFHSEDELDAVKNTLTSGCTNYWTGSEGRTFENEFAAFIGARHAIAVMNGTTALETALKALDIGEGDEVITSCRTFIASASCIVMRGATPILADVDINSQNITPATIEACITSRTKAIIVVHHAGWPAEMEGIMALATRYNLYVIEDCAQATGAIYKERRVGSWGHIATFSFCQDKIISTGGEGGMILTNDDMLWQTMWAFKDHGKNYNKVYQTSHPPGFRWLHDSFGTNFRMTEMQAAIGRIQLKKLPSWLATRKQNASILNEHFKEIPLLRVTLPPHFISHAYYKYYVFIRPEYLKKGWTRDKIMQEANAVGIPCFVGSCTDISLEKAFAHNMSIAKQRPVAKLLGETSLLFLVHPTLPANEVKNMATTLTHIFECSTEQNVVV